MKVSANPIGKGAKCAGRALDNGTLAGDEIENMHRATRVVLDRSGEPVPARLDELERMQPGPLLAPAVSGINRRT